VCLCIHEKIENSQGGHCAVACELMKEGECAVILAVLFRFSSNICWKGIYTRPTIQQVAEYSVVLQLNALH